MTWNLTAREAAHYGIAWQPTPLRTELAMTNAILAEADVIVTRTVSPSVTAIATVHPFARCTNPMEHRQWLAALPDGESCPDCPQAGYYASGPSGSMLQTADPVCDFHHRHQRCQQKETLWLRSPSDAVVDDDNSPLQEGETTEFTHHAPRKVRRGFASSPAAIRLELNKFLQGLEEPLREAEESIAAARAALEEKGPQTAVAHASLAEQALERYAELDSRTKPAVDDRHYDLRSRRTDARQQVNQLLRETAGSAVRKQETPA